MERGIIGERTKQALAYKRANHKKTGGIVPFGYDVTENGKLFKMIMSKKPYILSKN